MYNRLPNLYWDPARFLAGSAVADEDQTTVDRSAPPDEGPDMVIDLTDRPAVVPTDGAASARSPTRPHRGRNGVLRGRQVRGGVQHRARNTAASFACSRW